MNVWVSLGLFLAGVILAVKGGDWFVDAAGWIARAAHIPTFIIGATIVSIATTMPEMIVSILAGIEGKNEMAVGNAIGSVTANTGLIMAIAFIFMTVKASRSRFLRQYLILIASAAVLWIGSLSGYVAGWSTVVLILLFIAFMSINISEARQNSKISDRPSIAVKEVIKNIMLFIIGAIGIVIGSSLLIRSGSALAAAMGVPERVIAVTMVAIGTSLPELVTTLTAIKKKEASLSIGNIIGANIIDLALILPACSLVSGGTFEVSALSLQIDFPACLFITLAAVIPLAVKERAYQLQGILMLAGYAAYLVITI